MPTVLELLSYPAAYLEPQVGRDRHVACVKQAVYVAAKQKPIARLMCPPVPVRSDMGSL
jgi:hypothetical protein